MSNISTIFREWRRQDLLRGAAKIEIVSWGTHGGFQGQLQQLLDD